MTEERPWLKWALLLGGPTVWFVHFGLIYAASGLGHTDDAHAGAPTRIAVVLAGLSGIAVLALLMRAARRLKVEDWNRNRELAVFWRRTSTILLALTMLALLWETLPALIVSG